MHYREEAWASVWGSALYLYDSLRFSVFLCVPPCSSVSLCVVFGQTAPHEVAWQAHMHRHVLHLMFSDHKRCTDH